MKNTSHLRLVSFLISMLLILGSCRQGNKVEAPSPQDFESFSHRFVEALWQQFPDWASAVGYHATDHLLTIPDASNRAADIAFCNQYLDSLKHFEIPGMDVHSATDIKLIRNKLKAIIWETDTLREWEWNPSVYNPGSSFGYMLGGTYAPLDERLMAIYQKIIHLPAYYAAAIDNINNPVEEYTTMAIERTKGFAQTLSGKLSDSISISGLDEETKHNFTERISKAISAIEAFVSHLENDILPGLNDMGRDFRLGAELYKSKFNYNLQARYTPDEIYDIAIYERDETYTEMLVLTKRLWEKYFGEKPSSINLQSVDLMIEKIAESHTHRDSFQYAIEAQLNELTTFIEANDLLTLDADKPLVVREMPAYSRGISAVNISAPGPYDANEATYYNVNKLDGFSTEEAESFLMEYNDYMLQILNIHEAIPGHYTQLVYSNKTPSLIKSIFHNGTMVEGWACFAERMMLEAGYGDHAPELWLMYYKWYLRIISNTLLDIGVHTKNMSREDAIDLLVNGAFQETAEAEGKWVRVTRSSVQLCSYFTGLTEILDLRAETKSRQGDAFSVKNFNETFLGYGSIPVKYIRELMNQME